MTFDSTFTHNSDNNTNSLRKKIVVGGAIALLLGVATYSSNGATKPDTYIYKNLLRSNQGTDTDLGFGCALITSQVESAIGKLDEQLEMLPDPLVLEKDYVWTKKNVPLYSPDKLGCEGDITITVSKGALVSGLSQTNLEFKEKTCRFSLFRQSITGVWELSASSPSFELDATVTTKATNCEIHKGGSASIIVVGPTASATAGLTANANVITKVATFDKVSLDEVEVGLGSAVIDLNPGGQHHYSPEEGAAISKLINDEVVPAVNGFFTDRLPTNVSLDDVSTPEKAKAFLLKFFKETNNVGSQFFL